MTKNRPSGLKYNITKRNPGWFTRGFTPHNKGTKGVVQANSGSFKKGVRYSPTTEFRAGNKPWNKGMVSVKPVKPKRVGPTDDVLREKWQNTLWGQKYFAWREGYE